MSINIPIKLIVFDLDDTLLDTMTILIPIARTPAFEKRIREPLPLMPGALENLQALQKKYFLALLTQGRTEAQMQKVKSIGIASFFQKQCFADPTQNQTKQQFFAQLLADFKIRPQEMLSVGNRRSTDIREAKKLGAQTCLFNYGEHMSEKPECPEDIPDFEIHSHSELIPKCHL